ncbi:hypothetical protein HYPSUDRAFT_66875 [Hypholoma sublateritium FD-334 SS-4]|uniref:21S rRNA pseudouridine(2819) synthase n=1 Tax=Hypholoma sublateritium (strain FD-334 SS-4) TaxID=945553 RepID=A0A0D2MGD0_HYPSF|nr:hypothetical protein HYPSUDRAFT_66875 [Hypholoma sublateritium FD-334 SS-4]
MSAALTRLTQSDIYQRLQSVGSSWLKSHVLYADHKTVVLNKPAGLVCQLNNSDYKLKSERNHTFLNPVFEDIQYWLSPNAEPHSVHRLDKMTTGCFIVPITHASAKHLSTQFQHGAMKKTYLALVRGGEKSFPEKAGEINDPILYSDGRAEIHPVGKRAITRWKRLSSSPNAPVSLVELDLVTGNKHQLRIHLSKVLQTPILGDTHYSRKSVNASVASLTSIPNDRLFLHSADISFFQYYSTGRRYQLKIGAPAPDDFIRICDDLGISLPASYKQARFSVLNNSDRDDTSSLRLWYPGGGNPPPTQS